MTMTCKKKYVCVTVGSVVWNYLTFSLEYTANLCHQLYHPASVLHQPAVNSQAALGTSRVITLFVAMYALQLNRMHHHA